MDNLRLGIPKSDIQRAATHFNVPVTEVSGEMVRHVQGIPRGSGLEEAERNKELLLDIMEHEVLGSGRVIDSARAEATPCKGFTFNSDTYAWSPGILGLISSKKNPEQITKYCALGIEQAGGSLVDRFQNVKGVVEEAHQAWKKEGGDLESWWHKVGESLEKHKIEL
jgi:hypothetical protein